MAYYNGFPATYIQPVQQYYPQQQTNNGIIWCQGEQAAKSYLTAPNTTVALWDSESQKIYLKSTDASGMPSIKTLEYTILEPQNGLKTALNSSDNETHDYVTKNDLKGIYERLAALEGARNESVISADGAKLNHSEV